MSTTLRTARVGRTVDAVRIKLVDGLSSATRTPLSSYLDEYIAAEVECMVRDIGGWRRGRTGQDRNQRAMEWIAKNAASFRARWNREHEVVVG